MKLKKKRTFFLLFIALIALLSGCNGYEKSAKNNFYLSFTGESQTWSLSGYEVVITPDTFKVGNGTLNMKNEDKYITDYFYFETHAVINGEDSVVHTGSVSGAGIDIAEEFTGAIEGGEYLNEDGNPITLNEVNNIYMIVEWWDADKGDRMKEKIELYNKSNKESSFLN